MAEKYTNLRTVVDKLMRNPMLEDLQWEAAVDYTIDFMQIVGCPKMFEERTIEVTIANYRGVLPADWVDTIAVAYLGSSGEYRVGDGGYPMRHTTSTSNLDVESQNGLAEHVYMIQNSIIVCSFENGILQLNYRGIATDIDGLPLLIDNSAFTRALALYIKLQHFNILFDLGKIQQAVYQNTQQQYAWAVGACETDMHRLDLPKAEAFFNMYKTLLIRDNEYNNKFKNTGSKEFLISH